MNLIVMPLGRVSGRDRLVLEPILDLSISMWGFILFDPVGGVCRFDPIISWDITRTLYMSA